MNDPRPTHSPHPTSPAAAVGPGPAGARSGRARSPLRRLRRRIPLRVRHHWRLLVVCAAFLTALTLVFGTERVRPYVTSASDRTGDEVTLDIAGTRELFDPTVPHSISLTFRDADYQRMLDAYFDNGEKEYVEADLTIDGTTVPSVGIRLKGNSTLQGLTRNGETRQRRTDGNGPAGGLPEGAPPAGGGAPGGQTERGTQTEEQPGAPIAPGRTRPGGGPAAGADGQRAGGVGRSFLAAEEPEKLPWLISFDEYVEGRRYQGHREIAVRVAGMGGGSAVLNEAVALAMLDLSGEPAQRYAYTSFTVNDRPTTARLIVEHPDDTFAQRLGSTGVLYKASSTSQFTDQGDDPVDYQDDFRQITMKGSQDLQPVINLIRWVNSASDAEFAAQLADHVDVESLARYVALQNLLLNFDDMSGPGRNYYLWYDLETRRFRVVGWDYNLAFSGSADQGPHDAGRMGAGPGGRAPTGDAATSGTDPAGGDADAGGQPRDVEPPAGVRPNGEVPRVVVGPGGGRIGHPLKERFLASDAYTEVYEDAYRELYQQIYASGRAQQTVDTVSAVLTTVEGVDEAATTSEAARLRSLVQQRTESLAANAVIAGR